MPFERQVERLLGDGINLLPPSDLIGEGEAEKCVNFRVDQAGKLKARSGTQSLATLTGAWAHTIAVVEAPPDNRWYMGVDAKLYHIGTNQPVIDAITLADVLFDGDFLGWAAFHGYLWVINKTARGRDDKDLFYRWLPAAPSTAPDAALGAGTLSGAVKYYVTFSTAREYESNPSPVSVEISSATPFGVALTNIPVSNNPEVTKRHIYRVGGKLPAPYRVRTIEDNTTTSATDDGGDPLNDDEADLTAYFLTDAQAVDVGYVLEDDHDDPPAAFGLAGPYFSRLLAFNSTANPNRLWWTPSTKPWYFRGSASADGDWVDVGEELEPIYAVSVKPHIAIIYKKHSIWRIVGDLEDGVLEQITDKNGLRGPRAWTSHGAIDYFRGNEGIYLNTGDRIIKVSDKIDPIFKTTLSGVVSPTKPVDHSERYYEVMAVRNDRLYWSYTEMA